MKTSATSETNRATTSGWPPEAPEREFMERSVSYLSERGLGRNEVITALREELDVPAAVALDLVSNHAAFRAERPDQRRSVDLNRRVAA